MGFPDVDLTSNWVFTENGSSPQLNCGKKFVYTKSKIGVVFKRDKDGAGSENSYPK